MKKSYLFISITFVFFSCTKVNSNTANKYIPNSKWTIKDYSFENYWPMQIDDYGHFTSLANSDSIILLYTIENLGVEKSNSNYYSELSIHFLSPILSKTYAVVNEEINVPYNPGSCTIKFGSFTHPFGEYTSAGKPGDSVKIVVSNDTVIATFKNVTLLNDSAIIFNTPPHFELISGTLMGTRK